MAQYNEQGSPMPSLEFYQDILSSLIASKQNAQSNNSSSQGIGNDPQQSGQGSYESSSFESA